MDISRILTKEEKIFIKEHGLSYSDFCDARGEIAKVYHDKAKALGCRYVINSCMYGHRLKTRSGHCIQCDPRRIVFQRRFSETGVVYIATCGDYCKVGMAENNINSKSESMYRRKITLNMDGGYANLENWDVVKSWNVKDAGRMEDEVHKLLERYKVEDVEYWYSGEWRVAKELFKCSVSIATKAVNKVLDKYII